LQTHCVLSPFFHPLLLDIDPLPGKHASTGGWYFISLPADMASEIRENSGWQEQGWGRLKATVRIGNSEWDTAIW
jgi:hypothetical protein